MKLFNELKRAHEALAPYVEQWAVCGGVAASIYRKKPRFTDDIDFALIDSVTISARDLASKVISELGFKEYLGFVPNPNQKGSQHLGLLCARGSEDDRFVGLDFLLPVQFWIKSAVKLAQENLIDYGFARLPTITPESLILAKIASYNSAKDRLQDLDDIQEIIKSLTIDERYLREQLKNNNLAVPEYLSELLATTKSV